MKFLNHSLLKLKNHLPLVVLFTPPLVLMAPGQEEITQNSYLLSLKPGNDFCWLLPVNALLERDEAVKTEIGKNTESFSLSESSTT